MSDNESIAKSVLADLNANVAPRVNANAQIVKVFIKKLQVEIQKVGQLFPPFRGASIMHSGSAYEVLAVDENADFDILLVLGKPYIAKNFIARRDPSGYFILRWNSPEGPRGQDLDAASLQKELFDEIEKCVRRDLLPNAEISCKRGLAAMQITIARGGNRISIDLAPQIVCRTWDHCPGLIPLNMLPMTLQQHIANLQSDDSPIFYFTPAVPGSHPNKRWLCSVSFSQLEKEFIASSDIRDVVRLAKVVAYRRGWNEDYNLKSFHLKRMAITNYGLLRNRNLWDGFKTFLTALKQEVTRGSIDGYFIRNQVIWNESDVRSAFERDIAAVLNMNVRAIFVQR